MAHIHEKIDFVVETFIVHANKVLLRMHDKYGIWLAPGGHIELNEDPTQAAIREVKEEVGLDVVLWGKLPPLKDPKLRDQALLSPRFMNRHPINENHEHICSYYFATCSDENVVPSGADQSNEWHWFTSEELDDPKYGIREDIRFYAHEALRELGTAA
jgi:ADP-ribose pyrophosphatase YjhB (NUDIX family)